MKVIVSVINFKTKELTKNCLNSLLKQKFDNQIEIWLIDNASNDGSLEFLKKEFPKIKFIENKENLGFGKAHNQVFEKAHGDYYIVLNSDAEVEEGTIDGMVNFMAENQDCGLASCKILGFDGKLQPNGGDLPFGTALINWLYNLEILGFKKSFHRTESSYYEREREVGWLSGNFLIIKKEVLEKVKGFNPKYFMYFEDSELCFRIKKAGYKIMYTPKFTVKHLSGGSLDNPRLRQWVGEYHGLILFYKELYGGLMAFWVRMLIYKSTILRILAFALIGKLDYSVTYAKVITSI